MQLESLSEFFFYETGLCPQIDCDFREWPAAVQAEGAACDPAEIERLALGAFFAETGGDGRTTGMGWTGSSAFDDWNGVTTGGGVCARSHSRPTDLGACSRGRSRT